VWLTHVGHDVAPSTHWGCYSPAADWWQSGWTLTTWDVHQTYFSLSVSTSSVWPEHLCLMTVWQQHTRLIRALPLEQRKRCLCDWLSWCSESSWPPANSRGRFDVQNWNCEKLEAWFPFPSQKNEQNCMFCELRVLLCFTGHALSWCIVCTTVHCFLSSCYIATHLHNLVVVIHSVAVVRAYAAWLLFKALSNKYLRTFPHGVASALIKALLCRFSESVPKINEGKKR